MFPEGIDFAELMAQAQAMQAQLIAAQEELHNAKFVGTSGGGLVSVVVTGEGVLDNVQISPEAVDLDDLESLSDLIVAAARDAHAQVQAQAAAAMPTLPDLPGIDRSQLGL
ncbi:MAG: YbaB/EbfC family nucleoid-associated protein [Propionibacteriaceae bacterium]|jgi:DNA-binding YbaB/EbfC family protein|nr:YbaB/EbfC family nucleoid-associated protein [Propionibacteriaceae bacterium]